MIVDVVAGRQLLERRPMLQGRRGSCGWPHWGRAAFVGFNVGGILVTDLDLKEARWAGSSKLVKRTDGYEAFIW